MIYDDYLFCFLGAVFLIYLIVIEVRYYRIKKKLRDKESKFDKAMNTLTNLKVILEEVFYE